MTREDPRPRSQGADVGSSMAKTIPDPSSVTTTPAAGADANVCVQADPRGANVGSSMAKTIPDPSVPTSVIYGKDHSRPKQRDRQCQNLLNLTRGIPDRKSLAASTISRETRSPWMGSGGRWASPCRSRCWPSPKLETRHERKESRRRTCSHRR